MFLPLLMAAAVSAADAPAPAGSPAQAAASAAKPKPKGSELVCWQENPTGSHFPRRVCATRDQLANRSQRDQDAINQPGRPAPPSFTSSSGGIGRH